MTLVVDLAVRPQYNNNWVQLDFKQVEEKSNWDVIGENILSPSVTAEDRTRDTPHKNPTLYHVAIKTGFYRKTTYTCVRIILNSSTYPLPFLDSSSNLNLSFHEPIPDTEVLRAHPMG